MAARTPRGGARVPLLLFRNLLLLLLLVSLTAAATLTATPPVTPCPHPCACYAPTELHCTFRSLVAVPAGIHARVERINLGFNSIQALSPTSFAAMSRLELLMLHGNEISAIPDGALADLGSLQVLKLSYNRLRALTRGSLRGLRSLVRLHADHNAIEFVEPRAFAGAPALRLLQLEGNALRRLHPDALAAPAPAPALRHLYLGDNALRDLPDGALAAAPMLENLYLHGNPWDCGCRARWFREWPARRAGVLKCKKDKTAPGGQLCATCAGPGPLRGRELHTLPDAAPCRPPAIASALAPNRTRPDDDGDSDGEDSAWAPPWTVALNLTDDRGLRADLSCAARAPARLADAQRAEAQWSATLCAPISCPSSPGDLERVWALLGRHGDGPVTLARDHGTDGYHYYGVHFPGLRVRILPRPRSLATERVAVRFDRASSTQGRVALEYCAEYPSNHTGVDDDDDMDGGWVMIERGPSARIVPEGSAFRLPCDVIAASGPPSIAWLLPGGTVLQAPAANGSTELQAPVGDTPAGSTERQAPTGGGAKYHVGGDGALTVRPASPADSGAYACEARAAGGADRAAYRVHVEPRPARGRPPGPADASLRLDPGRPASLPCSAPADPEALVAWFLPDGRPATDEPRVRVTADGTLRLPAPLPHGGLDGRYACVAVNELGADRLSVDVAVALGDGGGSGLGAAGSGFRKVPRRPRVRDGSPRKRPAEGRRGFESRRRVHVASKQIQPERWADILARVRGRNPPAAAKVPGDAATKVPGDAGPHVSLSATAAPATDGEHSGDVRDGPGVATRSPAEGVAMETTVVLGNVDKMAVEGDAASPRVTVTMETLPLKVIQTHTVIPWEDVEPTTAVMATTHVHTRKDGRRRDKKWKSARKKSSPVAVTTTSVVGTTDDATATPLHDAVTLVVETSTHVVSDVTPLHDAVTRVLETSTHVASTTVSMTTIRTPRKKPHGRRRGRLGTSPAAMLDPTWPTSSAVTRVTTAASTGRRKHGRRPHGHRGDTSAPTPMESTLLPSPTSDGTLTFRNILRSSSPLETASKMEENSVVAMVTGASHSNMETLSSDGTLTFRNVLRSSSPLDTVSKMAENTDVAMVTGASHPIKQTPSSDGVVIFQNILQSSSPLDTVSTTKENTVVAIETSASHPTMETHVWHGNPVSQDGVNNGHVTATDTPPVADTSPVATVSDRPVAVSSDVPSSSRTSVVSTPARNVPETTSRPTSTWSVPPHPDHSRRHGNPTVPVSTPSVVPETPESAPDASAWTEHSGTLAPPTVRREHTPWTTTPPGRHGDGGPAWHPEPSGSTPANAVATWPSSTHVDATTRDATAPSSVGGTSPTTVDAFPGWPRNHVPRGHEAHATASTEGPAQRQPATAAYLPDTPGSFRNNHRTQPICVAPETPFPAPPVAATTERGGQEAWHADLGPPAPPGPRPPPTRLPGLPEPSVSSRAGGSRRWWAGPPAHRFWGHGEKPRIVTRPPPSAHVPADADAAFPCQATGNPRPFVTWTKVSTGALLTPHARLQRFAVLRNGTLLLRGAQPQDRGLYACTASNLHGADRAPLALSVSPPPPPSIREAAAEEVTARRGAGLLVPCSARDAAATVLWVLADGSRVRPSQFLRGNVFVFPNGTLYIRRVAPDDAGRYECVAANAAGAARRTVRIAVVAGDDDRDDRAAATVTRARHGDALWLHCRVAGDDGAPGVLWRLPSMRLLDAGSSTADGRARVFPNGTLRLLPVAAGDAGDYLCVSRRPAGDAAAAVRVSVSAEPARIERPRDPRPERRLAPGDDLRVDCVARGRPPPDVSWTLPDGSRLRVGGHGGHGAQDGGYGVQHGGHGVQHGRYAVQYGGSEVQHGGYGVQHGGHGVQHGGYEDQHGSSDVQHGGYGVQHGGHGVQHGGLEDQHGSSDVQHGGYGVKHGGSDVQHGGHGVQHGGYDVQNGDHGVQDGGPRIQDGGHGVQDGVDAVQDGRRVVEYGGHNLEHIVDGIQDGRYAIQYGGHDVRPRAHAFQDGRRVVQYGGRDVQNEAHRIQDGGRVYQYGGHDAHAFQNGLRGPTSGGLAYQDGGRRGGAPRARYVVFDNGTLLLHDVGVRDVGDYTCHARNHAGGDEVTVRVALARVPAAAAAAPSVASVDSVASVASVASMASMASAASVASVAATDSVHVAYGDDATIPCSAAAVATGATPPAWTFTWLSPTRRVLPARSDKYRVGPDGALDVLRARRSDAGAYTCVARRPGDGERRSTARLSVSVRPPLFAGHAEATADVATEAGGHVLVGCPADGTPRPRVLWILAGGVALPAPYRGGRVSVLADGTLDIRGARAGDAGRLSCVARNEGGEARLHVRLAILEPATRSAAAIAAPVFDDPARETIAASAGHTIRVNCSAAGAPPPRLEWILPEGARLAAGGRAGRFSHGSGGALHVAALTTGDAGEYRCAAANAAGRAERVVTLRVVPGDGDVVSRQPRRPRDLTEPPRRWRRWWRRRRRGF